MNIVITRKRIKHIILRVVNADLVRVSAPRLASEKEIAKVIENKKEWIEKCIARLPLKEKFMNGNFVEIMGHKYQIVAQNSIRNYIYLENNNLMVETINNKDLEQLYNDFLRREAEIYFQKKLDEMWSVVGIKPTLMVKNLKRTWGICNYKKHIISLSVNLYKKPQRFIEYVVLHELTHLLYPNHGYNFYAFIEKYMPDYKMVKKM